MRQRVSAGIVRHGKVLIVKDYDCSTFSLPGRGVEVGETLEEALVREVMEEVGLQVKTMKFIKSYELVNVVSRKKQQNHLYLVEASGEPQAGDEIEEILWMRQNDLTNSKIDLYDIEREEILPKLLSDDSVI